MIKILLCSAIFISCCPTYNINYRMFKNCKEAELYIKIANDCDSVKTVGIDGEIITVRCYK